MKRILIVNDDGINGPGLLPLVKMLKRLGTVVTIVPERERSTVSHALTLHKPLRMHEPKPGIHTLNGTPSDCARFGVLHLMKEKVDLVVSGINRGYNLGEDVFYSGTVAAAYEAALNGVPALAVSREWAMPSLFEPAARMTYQVVKDLLKHDLPKGLCLNMNVPAVPWSKLKGVKLASLGKRVYSKHVAKRKDPRGRYYYWMMGSSVSGYSHPGTDIAAVEAKHASLTPLLVDLTDKEGFQLLQDWRLEK